MVSLTIVLVMIQKDMKQIEPCMVSICRDQARCVVPWGRERLRSRSSCSPNPVFLSDRISVQGKRTHALGYPLDESSLAVDLRIATSFRILIYSITRTATEVAGKIVRFIRPTVVLR